MPDAGKKSKKPIIITLITLVMAAIVAVVLFLILKAKPLDKEFFVSDDTKLVYNVTNEFNEVPYGATELYMVYFLSGDKIDRLVTYYGYDTEDLAKAALEQYPDIFTISDDTTKVERDGRYILLTASSYLYEGTTVDSIKTIIDYQEKGDSGVIESTDENIIEDADVQINW